ncbi:hypothetical protein DCS_07072 [Drechmeria coniospora]|uniref:Coiled-coil domain-containing protein 174 n=1 Tax=Drechmeria coniospora TaxID=98403 RepID=A0A151GDE4_DRECN|nr:hypothetical protein DCS_07072 [Drechmeria coniospora]KYK55110.1 hypothetical protein DCS_07072 [Drechmeria coniospora]
MPQDPHLYGQRPAKKQKRNAALSTSIDFKAQLTSLISTAASSGTTSGRTRPSKQPKDDIFRSRTQRPAAQHDETNKLALKEVTGTEEEAQQLARARRKMEDKARRYAAMKRGDYVPTENEAESLVDFDRKWAEQGGRDAGYSTTTSSDEEEDGDAAEETIEWNDEFGRLRRGTRADKEKMERRARRGMLGAEELERMSARPAAPDRLIHGDAIQSMAFNPEDAGKMEELARKRDRSATPPEKTHYEADKEIRTKGVGFYKFSKDEDSRTQEMKSLEEERLRTERERQAREDQKEARRREIEKRRLEMGARRAKRQADNFLEGLSGGNGG